MSAPDEMLAVIKAGVESGKLIPYLGPGLLEADSPVPGSTRALAEALAARVPVSGRIRGNVWAVAQYIESKRHRVTLDRLMLDAFKEVPAPTPLHRWIGGLPGVRLVVDTWYDASLIAALAGRTDWGLMQGANRTRIGSKAWYRSFSSDGREITADEATRCKLLVYKPHGGIWPSGDVLISDADYVEALTEIDIQTPIPSIIQELRLERGFVFFGCRFYDQMLRTYARQIMKRSAGPHYALLPHDLTGNELRFLDEQNIEPVFVSPAGLV